METVKPITLCELKEKASKVQLKGEVISTINGKLEYNARTYALIGANIKFDDVVTNVDTSIKEALVSKIREIYNEFTITNDSNTIFIKEKTN